MRIHAKKAWGIVAALALALALAVPGMAFALDGKGDTSSAADGSIAVYVQDQEGNKTFMDFYSADEFAAMAKDVNAGYQFGTNRMQVATKLVSLDDLFADALGTHYGDWWTEGASVLFVCTDGPYTMYQPSYADLHAKGYFYPNRTATETDDTTGAVEVPAGISPNGFHASVTLADQETAGDKLAATLADLNAGKGAKPGTQFLIGADIVKNNPGWRLTGNMYQVVVLLPEGVTVPKVAAVQLNGLTVADYTDFQIADLATSSPLQHYAMNAKGSLTGVAAGNYVKVEDLIDDAGIASYWADGAKLQYICTDGPYGKSAPDYAEIQADKYFYPNLSADDLTNTTGAVEVPFVLSFAYATKAADGAIAGDAATAADVSVSATKSGYGRIFRGTSFSNGAIDIAGSNFATDVVAVNVQKQMFGDVAVDAWYAPATTYTYLQNIMGQGISDFGIGETLSRGQMVTVLWRAAGEPAAKLANPYTDVKPGDYYYEAVLWAAEQGITTDTGTKFAPNETVTREMMATFLFRYTGASAKQSTDAMKAFPDASQVDEWASTGMAWAVNNKVINGANGKLLPTTDLPREQAAQIFYNAGEGNFLKK